MSKVEAYRGNYASVELAVSIIDELLLDAEKNKDKVTEKMAGCIMGLRAIKETLYNLSIYGDLIPIAIPSEEVKDVEKTVEKANPILGADGQPIV